MSISGGRRYHISAVRHTVDIQYQPHALKEWVLVAVNTSEPGQVKATARETTSGSVLSEAAPKFSQKLRKATPESIAAESEYTWFLAEDSHGLGRSMVDPYNHACVLVLVETTRVRPIDSEKREVRMVLTQIPYESVRRAEPELLAWVVSQLPNIHQTRNRWVASYQTRG